MALVSHALRLIGPLLRGSRVLAFGYPELLADVPECEDAFGLPRGTLQRRSPHGAAHKVAGEIPDTVEAFTAAGATLECLDAFPSRDAEERLDLNQPLPLRFWGAYDLVLDAGTCEHVANVWQAVCNAAASVRPGGFVLHAPPLTMANHGLWSFQPTFLHSAYDQNGWRIMHLTMHSKSWPYRDLGRPPAYARFAPPDGTFLLFLAQRPPDAPAGLRPPVQEKYR